MKTKIVAALAVLGTFIGTLGDDVLRIAGRIAQHQGDDVVREIGGIAKHQGDDVARGIGGIAKHQGDDVARGIGGIAKQQGGVIVLNANVDIPQAKKNAQEAVYTQVRKAILSGVNQKSTDELLAIAQQANMEQSRQTGVLLNGFAVGIVVREATSAPTE
ncbi:hypothetical protein IQ247_25415 [Plectonema cf. radiosum LEGE 06105]|uniref:Uncharacterized protein n=1 Tax=Plectonema cf. radiosum LEGE 06105 TaxID=945769 RepID=A0A8J7FCI7_9CYAN|nr:hypothetical protein [Plectonema radiosum]MBE9215959.1 hypothetical protein [Plectonema cf. radiosum LEGE 06105]